MVNVIIGETKKFVGLLFFREVLQCCENSGLKIVFCSTDVTTLLFKRVIVVNMSAQQLRPLMLMSEILLLARMTSSIAVALKDDPPQMKANYQTEVFCEIGDTARIICPVHGSDERKPLVTWTRNDNLIHIGWDRYRSSRAGMTLLIDNAQEFDDGIYTCSASNGFGTVVVSIRLSVVANASITINSQGSVTTSPASRDSIKTSSGVDNESNAVGRYDDIVVRVEAVSSSIPISTHDDTEYDVIMTSLLCMGSAVVLTSLGALIATAVRRRLYYRRERRICVPEFAVHRLLAGPAVDNNESKDYCLYYPTATITSCSTLIGSFRDKRHPYVSKSLPSRPNPNNKTTKLCADQRCDACADCQPTTSQKPAADHQVALHWPKKAVDRDSSFCHSSMCSSMDSCASV